VCGFRLGHASLTNIRDGRDRSDRSGEFYANQLLPPIPPDWELTSLSQIFGEDRIVEELVIRFTYTWTWIGDTWGAGYGSKGRVRLGGHYSVSGQ
jgi:hypothetical protein